MNLIVLFHPNTFHSVFNQNYAFEVETQAFFVSFKSAHEIETIGHIHCYYFIPFILPDTDMKENTTAL